MSSSALRKLKQAQLTDQVAPPAKPQLVQEATVRSEEGPRGAVEIISPPEQMRRQIETSILRDNRVQRDVDVERARADIQSRLREALRKYNDHEGSDAISEIIFIRANVGEIKRRYVDIARRLFTLHRQTPEIYRALTRDPSLIDLGSDSDISKLRTVGEALHVGKVLEDWLPKSKEAAYEVAKLDEVVIREGRDSGIIVPDAKVSAIKAWVKSKSQRVMIEAVETVDTIDIKIGQLLKQQEDIQDEATRRINAISLEIKSLKVRKEELLKAEGSRQ
jgi:hypothetical protein